MPSHWGDTDLNIVSQSSPTGTQVLHAVGAAEAGVIYSRVPQIPDRDVALQGRRDRLRLARRGRDERRRVLGSAQHRVHSSACRCCSSSRTTATRFRCRSRCRRRAATSPGSCDRFPACTSIRSTAPISSPACAPCATATAYVRARKGPAFVHARVIRPYSHSLSDDEKLYKTPAEREAEARRDPIARFSEFLQHQRPGDRRGPGRDRGRRRARGERGGARGARRRRSRPKRHRRALGLFAGRRSDRRRRSTRPAQPEGKPDTMVGGDQPHAQGRDGARPAHRRLRRGRRRRQPAGGADRRARQGRRLQADARPAAPLRRRSRLQLAARRSQHRRPRDRHGDAQAEAGRRDPVLRLHLAGDDADPRRDVDAAVPLGQQRSRARWSSACRSAATCAAAGRITASRARASSRTVRAFASRIPSNAVDAAGLLRTVDPLRRSGAVPRAQAPLPADLQQGRVSRAKTS